MIDAEALRFGRDGFAAGPLTLRVEPGQLVALLGPNGSGKTSLLRTLARLWQPISGRCEVRARPVLLEPPVSVPAPFTARHMVLLGRVGTLGWSLRFTAEDRAVAEAAMRRTGVLDLSGRRFDRLSSGQQQRVRLAQALAREGQVLLLDEPTALLDPAQAADIRALVTTLASEGRAVIVATHDLDLARRATVVVAIGTPCRIVPAPFDEARLETLYRP